MNVSTFHDLTLAKIIDNRESDWRVGAVVYQVLVDRFAPTSNLDDKKHLYPSPKVLKHWDETPQMGEYLADERLWSHEIEFWGGDLASLTTKLDYISELDVDVLYLNPIHYAYTNHKYDSLDFDLVSPEFGDRNDVKSLAQQVHQLDMKIVLDGVFNHMGQNANVFIDAKHNEDSTFRDWFYFGEQYPEGYRAWDNATNLPELNLENKAVRESLYILPTSTVKSYLADGIDGWRLDVAHDIGFNYLKELTAHAHDFKPCSLIIGEVWSYPKEWLDSIDGIMNLSLRHIIIQSCLGNISPSLANRQIQEMVADSDYEGLLKSWLLLDNHDTPRLPHLINNQSLQNLAQVMQFTLPGSPNVYYGSELGMTGGDDPEMRAPMRWDWVTDDNVRLIWTKKLIKLRKAHRALRVGQFKTIETDSLIAYIRYTDKVEDACIIVINPTEKSVSESLMVPYSKLMNMGEFIELLGDYPDKQRISASFLTVEMPCHSSAIFKANTAEVHGYTSYKRVR